MKNPLLSSKLLLLLIPFFFTGCYTQFQTYDRYDLNEDDSRGFYSWDGPENARSGEYDEEEYAGDPSSVSDYEDEAYIDPELKLEMMEIYYQDYETKQWYEDHYAQNLYWKGYYAGYEDAIFMGYSYNYLFNLPYSYRWYNWYYGYRTPFGYNSYRYYPRFYGSYWYNDSYYYEFGIWGAFDFYYDPYWGHPYYNYHYAYNAHYRNNKYRNADVQLTGPRSSGLTRNNDSRIRDNRGFKTGNTGLRSRGGERNTSYGSGNTRSRLRDTQTKSIGRGSSSGVSRTRGTSVGKKRTGTTVRSRGSSTGTSKGKGSSSKKRDRGNQQSVSNVGNNVHRVTTGSTGETFTIPSRKIKIPAVYNTQDRSSKVNYLDRFRNNSERLRSSRSSSINYRNESGSTFRTKTSRSGSSQINRSSTVKSRPSAGTRQSKSKSTSSSKKRSRDN